MAKEVAIVACCDPKMLPGACCALLSAYQHIPGRKATFFLIVRDASEADRQAIERFQEAHSIAISVTYVTGEDLFEEIRGFGAYALRLQLDAFLGDEFERVLYLDSDTIVIDDLGPLFDLDFKGHLIAAVDDFMKEIPHNIKRCESLGLKFGQYFNSGVILFNWTADASEKLFAKTRKVIISRKLRIPDQDALNEVVANRWLRLPVGWNFGSPFHSRLSLNPKIVHFTGGGKGRKPWEAASIGLHKDYRAFYVDALNNTPWSDFVQTGNWKDRLQGEMRAFIEGIRRYSNVVGFLKRHKPENI